MNPFRDIARETVVERTVTITVDELRKWLGAGQLPRPRRRCSGAPRAQVALRKCAGLDLVRSHRSRPPIHHHPPSQDRDDQTKRPQVVPVSEQLRVIPATPGNATHAYVVEYRQQPVKTIRGGLRTRRPIRSVVPARDRRRDSSIPSAIRRRLAGRAGGSPRRSGRK